GPFPPGSPRLVARLRRLTARVRVRPVVCRLPPLRVELALHCAQVAARAGVAEPALFAVLHCGGPGDRRGVGLDRRATEGTGDHLPTIGLRTQLSPGNTMCPP